MASAIAISKRVTVAGKTELNPASIGSMFESRAFPLFLSTEATIGTVRADVHYFLLKETLALGGIMITKPVYNGLAGYANLRGRFMTEPARPGECTFSMKVFIEDAHSGFYFTLNKRVGFPFIDIVTLHDFASGNASKDWQSFTFDLYAGATNQTFQLEISRYAYTFENTSIAVDDLKFSPGCTQYFLRERPVSSLIINLLTRFCV